MGIAMGWHVRAHGFDPEEEVPLVALEDYRARILARVVPLEPRSLALVDAWGCVAAADVRAPADLPPFASSAMDGYAVRASDIATATDDRPRPLRVTGEVLMGRATELRVGGGEAVAVPTGGVVPDGADTVVPVELCAVDGDRVLVLRSSPAGKHVRPAGEDVRVGDVLVGAGRRLAAPDLGALAGAGFDTVLVHPRVRVGIVSTGDELVAPGGTLTGAQIFDANASTVAGAVLDAGAVPVDGGIARDDPGALVAALDRIAGEVDVFVCSGGVSVGERDPVKRAFRDGGDVEFVSVAMQPGRPQAFGTWRGKPLFGLPGNPVSVFVSFEMFVRPALLAMMRRPSHPTAERRVVDATLEQAIEGTRTRTRFARVRVRSDRGRYVATPEGGHQSNLLATFARSDGLAVIEPGAGLKAGDMCRVILLRDI